jgi:hypothetical protein
MRSLDLQFLGGKLPLDDNLSMSWYLQVHCLAFNQLQRLTSYASGHGKFVNSERQLGNSNIAYTWRTANHTSNLERDSSFFTLMPVEQPVPADITKMHPGTGR